MITKKWLVINSGSVLTCKYHGAAVLNEIQIAGEPQLTRLGLYKVFKTNL